MPRKHPFRVGRSRTGLGLFATAEIKKGDFIVEYKGRIIPDKEARLLEDETSNRYLYEINGSWTVDGSSRRNIARYANHSCRPNAESDTKKHMVFIRATKRIQPGDEITYDYGKDYIDAFFGKDGCLCLKCIEKRREARVEKRRNAKAARKRAETRARNARAAKRAKAPRKLNGAAPAKQKTAAKGKSLAD